MKRNVFAQLRTLIYVIFVALLSINLISCEPSLGDDSGGNIENIPKETIKIGKYGSDVYCSTSALDFSKLKRLKAYVATGYDDGVVIFTRVKTVKYGEGILVKGTPGDYKVPILERSNDNTLNLLVGVQENLMLPSKSLYGFKYKGVYQYNYNTTWSVDRWEQAREEAAAKGLQLHDLYPVACDDQGNTLYGSDRKPLRMAFYYKDGNAIYYFRGGDAIYDDINHDGNINQLDMYLGSADNGLASGSLPHECCNYYWNSENTRFEPISESMVLENSAYIQVPEEWKSWTGAELRFDEGNSTNTEKSK